MRIIAPISMAVDIRWLNFCESYFEDDFFALFTLLRRLMRVAVSSLENSVPKVSCSRF